VIVKTTTLPNTPKTRRGAACGWAEQPKLTIKTAIGSTDGDQTWQSILQRGTTRWALKSSTNFGASQQSKTNTKTRRSKTRPKRPVWRPKLVAKIGSRQHSWRSKLASKLSTNSSVKTRPNFDFAQHFPFLGERNCGPNSRPRSTIWWILGWTGSNWEISVKVEVFLETRKTYASLSRWNL
jgi:hypothetical protein